MSSAAARFGDTDLSFLEIEGEEEPRAAGNPCHDPATGQFCETGGGAAGASGLANPQAVLGLPSNLRQDPRKYIAAHGQEFNAQPLPADVEPGTPKECYRNASMLVMSRSDLTYAEGFAETHKLPGLAFLHAWAVDRSGNVVDPTWPEPAKAKYFGVKYDRIKYLKALYKQKLFGVLGAGGKVAEKAIATDGRALR